MARRTGRRPNPARRSAVARAPAATTRAPPAHPGATDVGEISRQVAEASVVAKHTPHRQRDSGADNHRFDRDVDLLTQPGGNAVRTLPVGGIDKPAPKIADAHEGLPHGTTRRWAPARARSANSAITMQRAVATTSGVRKSWIRPLKISCP